MTTEEVAPKSEADLGELGIIFLEVFALGLDPKIGSKLEGDDFLLVLDESSANEVLVLAKYVDSNSVLVHLVDG